MSRAGQGMLDGQVAVVTGAGAGLGKAYACLLAELGARVVVNDLGGSVAGRGASEDAARQVVSEIEAAGGVAIANSDSVATPEGGAAIVDAAAEAFGRVDILVHNAGILRDHQFEDLDTESWQAVRSVHLDGAYHVARPAWRHMRRQAYGRIVLTTSAAGIFGNTGHANYGAAKMGVLGLTRMLAVEGEPLGIRANAVAPLASTRMSASKDGDRARAADLAGGLFDRLLPEHIAPLVALLSAPECPANGEVFSAGGGRIARIFIAEAPGHAFTEPTVEAIRQNWEKICDTDGYTIPRSMADELKLYTSALPVIRATHRKSRTHG